MAASAHAQIAADSNAVALDSTQTLSEKLKQLFTKYQTDSSNASLNFDIAQEYLSLQRKAYAVKFLEKSTQLDPTNMDMAYAKGQLYLELGRRKSGYQTFLAIMRDFKGEAYLDKIGSRFASPYKVTALTTNTKFNDVMPSFSPDGSKIVFQSDRSGNWDIYTLTLAQGENSVKKLTEDLEADENPSFSADGRYIVFTSTRDDKTTKKYKPRELYYMDVNGKKQLRITTSYGADNWNPSFVDTTTIVFASDRKDFSNSPFWKKPSSIYTIEKTGNFLFNLVSQDTLPKTDPHVDIGGTMVVYAAQRDGSNYDVFTIAMDGKSSFTDISKNPSNDIEPAISKDRLFVAFVTNRDGNYEVYKMQVDGKEPTRITYDDADDLFPHFSPDGTKIVFCSNRNGAYQIYLASTEETTKTSVQDVIAILEKKAATATDN